jgi:hypothetical protein
MGELYGRPAWLRGWKSDFYLINKLTEGKMEEAHFKFWYVYSPTGITKPAFQHNSEPDANREAHRLAKANPGQEFLVLEAKRSIKVEPNPIKIVEYEDLPF